MENKIRTLLCELGVCDEQAIVPFYPKVRDRDDVAVLRCRKSGVLLLSRSDHMEISHYEDKEYHRYVWGDQDRKAAMLTGHEDASRRFEQFKNIVVNRKWVDVGTGVGAILDLMAPMASEVVAVEPQENARELLVESGYRVFPSLEGVPDEDFEVATLFHVFEHLTDPIGTLETLRSKMSKGGKLVIEVPHARDLLLSFLGLESFKAFTLWSEHLILHTRESLRTFLESSGFTDVSIMGYQRYPVANHLHWLAKDKPGGHIAWNHLRTPALDAAYQDMLAGMDATDTLIAVATKG